MISNIRKIAREFLCGGGSAQVRYAVQTETAQIRSDVSIYHDRMNSKTYYWVSPLCASEHHAEVRIESGSMAYGIDNLRDQYSWVKSDHDGSVCGIETALLAESKSKAIDKYIDVTSKRATQKEKSASFDLRQVRFDRKFIAEAEKLRK